MKDVMVIMSAAFGLLIIPVIVHFCTDYASSAC